MMASRRRSPLACSFRKPAAQLLLAVSLIAWPGAGEAAPTPDSTEPTIDVQLFYPSPGLNNFMSVESGEINGHLGLSTGLILNYARNPLAVRIIRVGEGSAKDVGAVVANRLDFNLVAAIGLFGWGDIGVVMPLVLQGGLDRQALGAANIDVGAQELVAFSPGDVRIVPKLQVVNIDGGRFAVAILPSFSLPSGGKTDYAAENGVVFSPSVAASVTFGPLRAAINLGYRLRDRTEVQTLVVDDELYFKLAGGFDLTLGQGPPLELMAELHGHTPAGNVYGSKAKTPTKKQFQKARSPLEFDIGARFVIREGIALTLGAGGGILPGYGAPAPRFIFGATYYTGNAGIADADKDGVPDGTDQCPERKEDIDGFEDGDGCPEFDNDKDKITDEDDQCPNVAEDRDGFNDEDGCPDPDNDGDGLKDGDDTCPNEAEDKDGFEDADGCPDLDNDGDGIADVVDQCKNEAEDKDGYLDTDGCPDEDNDNDGLKDLNDLCPNHAEDMDGVADDDGCPEDNDGDGIPDAIDKCPNKAEIYNGIADDDGCPEKLKTRSLVKVTDEKIEIKDKVFFRSGSSKILPKSFALLDQVAAVLRNYKHIKKVRVEGHTDSRGPRRKNRRLSQQRADSVVKYLLKKGVKEGRLLAEGFGPDKPIASNRSGRGRESNRRVEFVIVELKPIGKDVTDDQPVPPPPPAAPAAEPKATGDDDIVFEGDIFDDDEPAPAVETPKTKSKVRGKARGKGKGKRRKGKAKTKKAGEDDVIDFNF